MNETTYSLEWRGARKSGLSYADIEAGLASGDLHSLYKIHVNGKWTVLRDFLEQQRALPAPFPAGQFNPPHSARSPLPRPEPSATLPPATPLVQAMPPAPTFPAPSASDDAIQKPVWFWPVIIISSTVCLLLVIVLAYLAAISRSRSQRTGGSSSQTSVVKISKKDGVLIGITTLATTSSQTEAIPSIHLAPPLDSVLSDLF